MLINELHEATVKQKNKVKPDNKVVATIDWASHVVATAEKIAGYMKKNCKPWLKQTNNGKLTVFRGLRIDDTAPMAFARDTRTNRIPKDTTKTRHQLFDLLISTAGCAANRTNSLFVTGSHSVADDYGQPFVLIPVGPFNYSWSPVYSDWTNEFYDHNMPNYLTPKGRKQVKDMANDSDDRFDDLMDKQQISIMSDPSNINIPYLKKRIKCTDLQKAIKSDNEIMIQCIAGLYIRPEIYAEFVLPILAGKKPNTKHFSINDFNDEYR